MKHWLLIAVLIAAQAPGRPDASGYVSFPGAGARLVKPAGFTEAERFHGFQQPGTQSSVMVVRVPGPYPEVTRGFTAAQLQTRGMQLHSKASVKIDGLPGVLLKVTQRAYQVRFMKWILAFGDETQTFVVTAAFPEARQAQLSGPLKAAVLSARRERTALPEPGADVPFTIAASPKLKSTRGIGKMLVYTLDGVLPARSREDPLFIAGPSLSKVPVADQREFAIQRLRQTAKTNVTTVTSHEPIRIDGLDGYETVAEARDAGSGVPLLLYQVILFDDGSYTLMQGRVGAQHREEYLSEFKAMARSFKRKLRD
jgi:hypothetical protein